MSEYILKGRFVKEQSRGKGEKAMEKSVVKVHAGRKLQDHQAAMSKSSKIRTKKGSTALATSLLVIYTKGVTTKLSLLNGRIHILFSFFSFAVILYPINASK